MAQHTLRTLSKQCVSLMYSQRLMKPNKLDVLYFQTPLRIYINNNPDDWKKYKCDANNYHHQKKKYDNLLTECNSHYRLIIPTNDIISSEIGPNMLHFYDEFQFILISWKKKGVSSIHSHTTHGCVFGVLNGTLLEKRYYINNKKHYLSDFTILNKPDVGYINDDEAEHRIWNINDNDGLHREYDHESDDEDYLLYSHSLHIYSSNYKSPNINRNVCDSTNNIYYNTMSYF